MQHADPGAAVAKVLGHAAAAHRDRVVSAGFVGTEVSPDGCGLWKVSNDGIDSYEQGQGTAAEARAVGFEARLEIDPG